MASDKKFKSLKEFYPFYLTEHSNSTCRKLHFVGTAIVILVLFSTLYAQVWSRLWLIPLIGYGFAWVGHFVYEKNKPATFQYPFYSLASDFIMFWHLLIGKEKFSPMREEV